MLKLPDIPNAGCRWMTACGHVEDHKSVKAELRALKSGVVTRKKSLYIGIVGSEAGHLHIDLFNARVMGPPPPHVTIVPLKEASDLVRPFYGQRIDASLSASFTTTPDRFPALIRRQRLSAKSGKVSLEVVSGGIKVSGAPFDEITWSVNDDGEARMRFEAHHVLIFDDQYLLQAFAPLETGFLAFISEGTPND